MGAPRRIPILQHAAALVPTKEENHVLTSSAGITSLFSFHRTSLLVSGFFFLRMAAGGAPALWGCLRRSTASLPFWISGSLLSSISPKNSIYMQCRSWVLYQESNGQMQRCISILHSRNRPPRLRVRGLPFSTTKAEVASFFKNYRLAGPYETSVCLLTLPSGRPSGEAIVFFEDAEEAFRAQKEQHMKFLGTRFLELLIDFDTGGPQSWIDARERSEHINRKRYIGDNR
ncbi:uncharacterized protein LOC113146465 [Cyclospora cayetanensis]|uniref:Uncharacterized protein LOC113146465 n=1 Tax=Cyclospora cayetanensis TaxID=88456 RepID=A0A6P6RRF0_9EIME|nr:uncharacterized protein LOC113146465 [Cyclospora cayetanensis]